MTQGGIEFLTDANPQGHGGIGIALLKALGLGGDVVADLGIKGEGVSADVNSGTTRTGRIHLG